MRHHCLLLLCACCLADLSAAVFQYRQAVLDRKDREQDVFCWIPPAAEHVRGVLIGGMTLAERDIARDERIRAACTEAGLAIVFSQHGLGGLDLPALLTGFAAASGYPELAHAPFFLVGHSAGGPQARQLAATMPDRCIGLMQYRGGAPLGEPPVPAGIPCLMMVGQFDEFGGDMRTADGTEPAWERARDAIAAYRAADPGNLGAIVVEPGAGHFAWSERSAAILAPYITAAAAARIPADWPAVAGDRPPELIRIDPATGFLASLRLTDPVAPPAAATDYQGDPVDAGWFPTAALAKAATDQQTGLTGQRDQFIAWQDPHWVDAGTRYFFHGLDWIGDGASFEVHPVYAEQYPSPQDNGQGPRWARAGEPCGHSDAPIRVRHLSGPIVATGDHTLQIRFDATAPATDGFRLTFLAYSQGDAEYRYTELVGMAPRGFKKLKKGRAQTITFPQPADITAAADPIDLGATSDAGLPVHYYVAWGPAVVVDGQLTVRDLPQRASFPIPIRVVAWQFGSGVEPQVQTAAPVVRDLLLSGP